MGANETVILDAVRDCVERWGPEKVTVDDIAATARVSRATLYRLFPGGKDVLFEAYRVRELNEFFDRITSALDRLDGSADVEDVVVQLVVTATRELRSDEHLALLLAAEPGEVLTQLTVAGLPRILRVANAYITPVLEPHLPVERAPLLIDLLVRITISYFLARSEHVDLGDPTSAREFLRPGLAAIVPAHN